ncbi:MAG: three-Cys-motif partner protein TcmP [Alphaproteobacteria bacterium]|nr:three-Cys-motif partner protein TcmP [Alphaproteobacteria bacterium]
MVEKSYAWADGARLEEHTKRKHKILREYFARYLAVRCQYPQQSRFRLAVIDGFAGAGRYACGTAGSPLIFIEVLRAAVEQFNIRRSAEGMSPIDIECLLVLNDLDATAISLLKSHIEPQRALITSEVPRFHLHVEYRNTEFETLYPEIKSLLDRGRYRSVIFSLDQCGHSHVHTATIRDIMGSFPSAEIFYTFAIQSLLAFLARSDPQLLKSQPNHLGVGPDDLRPLEGMMNNQAWLGTAEKMVFEAFRACAPFVSPFSIHNPEGWRYWFIHFANSYRARQEYNNVLHQNSSMQAHFGRSGLNMLSFNPVQGGALYLFDVSGRSQAKEQLMEDIPRLVTEFGDTLGVGEFYETIYKMTPAHMDDVHSAIIDNPDMEVITENGGERRKATTISPTDILRMKQQRSFFPLFLGPETGTRK